MPRRGNVAKRDVLPDPVYNSKLVTRLINNIMYDGKAGRPYLHPGRQANIIYDGVIVGYENNSLPAAGKSLGEYYTVPEDFAVFRMK